MPHMDSFFVPGADDPRQFPDDVDQAVTRAMLAAASMYGLVRVPATGGSFKPYVHQTNLAPNLEGEQALSSSAGQIMIKKGIDILRGIRSMPNMELFAQEHEYDPSNNQLNHVVAERRRRKKLNEHFHALRLLLPPGFKKDKVSVLVNARNYLKSLRSQVKQLEERNRMLQMQLFQPEDDADPVTESSERVQVEAISGLSTLTSSTMAKHIKLKVIAMEECDTMDLVVRLLECIKAMKDIALVSVHAAARPQPRQFGSVINLRLQVEEVSYELLQNTYICEIYPSQHLAGFYKSISYLKVVMQQAGAWDEEGFKEAVERAVILDRCVGE